MEPIDTDRSSRNPVNGNNGGTRYEMDTHQLSDDDDLATALRAFPIASTSTSNTTHANQQVDHPTPNERNPPQTISFNFNFVQSSRML